MNKKRIQQEIKKALDNLDGLKLSNTIKAESIMGAIVELLEREQQESTPAQQVLTSKPFANLGRKVQ